MAIAPAKSPPPSLARAIVRRTRGRTHGPITRLMSPSDFGEILKPFVFLDLFDHEGAPFAAGLHPHSGIATLTYVAEGSVRYIDPRFAPALAQLPDDRRRAIRARGGRRR